MNILSKWHHFVKINILFCLIYFVFKQLEWIDLNANLIDDTGATSLIACIPALKVLHLRKNKISQAAVLHIKKTLLEKNQVNTFWCVLIFQRIIDIFSASVLIRWSVNMIPGCFWLKRCSCVIIRGLGNLLDEK